MSQYRKILTAGLAALSLMVQAAAPAWAGELIIDEGGPVIQEFPEEEEQGEQQSSMTENGDTVIDSDEVDFDALFEGEETITFDNSGMTAEDAAAMDGNEVLPEEVFLLRADQENVRYSLEKLLSVPDPIGSDGELEIATFIKTTMLGLGYTVSEQAFHEGHLNENGIDPPGLNIIAERGADAEERTNGILILCAHYDSKSVSGEAPAGDAPIDALAVVAQEAKEAQSDQNTQSGTEAQNGSDMQDTFRPVSFSMNDKSGAAVLLETARILAQEETAMDICFVFLSGEEDGYYGSKHIAEWLSDEQRSRVQGVICLGELGVETEDAPVYLLGTTEGEENNLTGNIRACAEKLGYGNGLRQPEKEEEILAEALAFAQNGMDTEPALQGERADSGQEMAEAAFDEIPANWSTAVLPTGSHTAFAQLGLPAVCIFQDTEETFRIVDGRVTEETEDTEAVTEADTETETETETEAETETETETETGTGEKDKISSDTYALSQIADLVAEAVFLYMQ